MPTVPLHVRHTRWMLAAILLTHLVLGYYSSRTKRPWSDEGWFANPALNLAQTGVMGTTVIDTTRTKLIGIERHTYWVMPLDLLNQALWYRIFGFGLVSMRMLSVTWGLVLLFSFYHVAWRLVGEEYIALLATALLGLDYTAVTISSFGRMDMMCAALGVAGLAAYLSLRERSLPAAVVCSHGLVAASVFTHPNGIYHFAALLFLQFALDRSRTLPAVLALGAVPYLAFGAMWLVYVLQSPSDFVAQFFLNAGQGRLDGFRRPWLALYNEVTARYLPGFGLAGHLAGHPATAVLKSIVLVVYWAAPVVCLVSTRSRRNTGVRRALQLLLLYFVAMTFFNQKLTWYLIHILPWYCLVTALAARDIWRQGRRVLVSAAAALLLAVQVGGILARIRIDTYHHQFAPASAFLNSIRRPGDSIRASAEMGFGIGFVPGLLDDSSLGFFSDSRPEFLVVEEIYRDDFRGLSTQYPGFSAFLDRRLNREYHVVYQHNSYTIYERLGR